MLDLGDTVRKMKREFGVDKVLAWHAMSGYWAGVDPEARGMAPFEPRRAHMLAPEGVREVDPEVSSDDIQEHLPVAHLCDCQEDVKFFLVDGEPESLIFTGVGTTMNIVTAVGVIALYSHYPVIHVTIPRQMQPELDQKRFGMVPSKRAESFFMAYHKYLKDNGVDGVKVETLRGRRSRMYCVLSLDFPRTSRLCGG